MDESEFSPDMDVWLEDFPNHGLKTPSRVSAMDQELVPLSFAPVAGAQGVRWKFQVSPPGEPFDAGWDIKDDLDRSQPKKT